MKEVAGSCTRVLTFINTVGTRLPLYFLALELKVRQDWLIDCPSGTRQPTRPFAQGTRHQRISQPAPRLIYLDARVGNRRLWPLSAQRAHAKGPTCSML